jgi:hypothetical protein
MALKRKYNGSFIDYILLISNPKAQFLLGAGLDVLHHESTEWLETIAFWEDEMKSFLI